MLSRPPRLSCSRRRRWKQGSQANALTVNRRHIIASSSYADLLASRGLEVYTLINSSAFTLDTHHFKVPFKVIGNFLRLTFSTLSCQISLDYWADILTVAHGFWRQFPGSTILSNAVFSFITASTDGHHCWDASYASVKAWKNTTFIAGWHLNITIIHLW